MLLTIVIIQTTWTTSIQQVYQMTYQYTYNVSPLRELTNYSSAFQIPTFYNKHIHTQTYVSLLRRTYLYNYSSAF